MQFESCLKVYISSGVFEKKKSTMCFLSYETLKGEAQLFKIKLIPKEITSQTQFTFSSMFMECSRSN